MSTSKLLAPAKVNLTLAVTGKDARGYHLLDSLVVFTHFGDRISVTPADQTELTFCGRPVDGDPADNLLLRALSGYNGTFGTEHRIRIDLEKHIPVAAGLGGGSADAAAMLRYLCEVDDRAVGSDAVQTLSLTLGADVPVCLTRSPQRMRGIGEQLTAVTLAPQHIVLVNPNLAVPTGAVFAARDATFSNDYPPTDPIDLTWVGEGRNDLEPPALMVEPRIADVLGALRATGPTVARMSGSGATCFGLYKSDDRASEAATTIAAQHPEWFVAATQSFGSDDS